MCTDNNVCRQIWEAVTAGHVATTDELLHRRVDLNARFFEGNSYLFAAVSSKQEESLKGLLHGGVDINAQRDDGMSPLSYAVVKGFADIVKILLDNGADLETRDSVGRTALYHASRRRGRSDVVQLLTERGAVVNVQMNDGTSALTAACHVGQHSVVTTLLDNGADINSRDENGWTPLHWAAHIGHADVVNLLLVRGANVNATTYDTSCLLAAVLSENLDTVRAVVSAGADVNVKNEDGASPLHMASVLGLADIANILVDGGARLEDRDSSGRTPLLLAVVTGRVPVISVLAEHGADVNSRFVGGNCYLTEASLSRKIESVKALLRAGTNVNAQRDDGMTPVNIASALGAIDIVAVLLDNGADIESRDGAGRTPLFSAAHNGHFAVVKLLFERGSTVNRLNDGSSALADSCFMGHSDIVRLMLDHDADVNCRNIAGCTPLYYSAEQGHAGIVQVLLSTGDLSDKDKTASLLAAVLKEHANVVDVLTTAGDVDVNVRNADGMSALHLASLSGYVEGVKVLLKNNAEVDIRDNDGWTSLYHAARNGLADVVELLLDSGADPNSRTRDNNSCLPAAVYSGNKHVVRALLLAGAAVKTQHSDGVSALHVAAEEGYCDIVNELLHKDAEVDISDGYDRTPLHCAAQEGHADVVAQLVNAGADINTTTKDKSSCLLDAVLGEHVDVVRVLVSAGVDVNLQRNDGISPLHAACQEGHIDIMRTLMYGSDEVDEENDDNAVPLYVADSETETEVLELLVDAGGRSVVATDAVISKSLSGLLSARFSTGSGAELQKSDDESSVQTASGSGSSDTVCESLSNDVQIDIRDHNGCTPLHYAAENGRAEAARLLIAAGAGVNSTAYDNTSCLLAAVFNGHTDVVRLLVSAEADVNTRRKDGCSPLSFASEHGYIDVVKVLLDNNADIETREKDGRTPLLIAAGFRQADVLRMLLSAGADVNAQRYDGASALHVTSGEGYVDIVSVLLNTDADIEVGNNVGRTPLMYAAIYGYTDVVRALLSVGADVAAVCNDGVSALGFASQEGYIDAVNVLLDNNAQLAWRDYNGETPLWKAAERGHVKVIEALVARGADIDGINYGRYSPIAEAARKGHTDAVMTLVRHAAAVRCLEGDWVNPVNIAILFNKADVEKILQLLISNGAQINGATSSLNETALMCTSYSGNVDVARLLVKYGADIHVRNLENLQTIDEAGYCGQVEIVKLLSGCYKSVSSPRSTCSLPLSGSRIDCYCNTVLHVACDLNEMKSLLEDGAEVEAENVDGVRPIHCAVRTGMVELVELLIRHGASVNAADMFGNTPLHEGVSQGLPVVELLVRRGAKLNAQNIDGKTPLHIAVERQQSDAISFLLSQDADVGLTDLWRNTPLHYVDSQLLMVNGVEEGIVKLLNEKYRCLGVRNCIGVSPMKHLVAQGILKLRGGKWCTDDDNVDTLASGDEGRTKADKTSNGLKDKIYRRNDMPSQKDALCADCLGNTPLHYAVGVYGKLKMFKVNADVTKLVELLVSRGISINARNNDGLTPLHVACGEESLKACLQHIDDSSFTASDKRGRNFWHLSFISRNMSNDVLARNILPFFSASGFEDLYSVDDLNRSPLHYACMNRLGVWYTKLRKKFLESAIDEHLNKQDSFGRTALHYAAIANDEELQNSLRFVKNSDDTIRDNFDLTASDYTKLQNSIDRKVPLLRMTKTSSFMTRYFRSVSTCIGQCFGCSVSPKYGQELRNVIHELKDSIDCTQYVLNTYLKCRFDYSDVLSKWHIVQKEITDRNAVKKRQQVTTFAAIQSHVDEAMRFLADEISAQDGRFSCEVFTVGSGPEGTKIGRCDEFDYNFVLTHLSKSCRVGYSPESPPGFVLLKASTPGYDEDLFNDSGTLNTRIVKFKFETLVKNVLSSARFCEEKHFEFIDPVSGAILPDGNVSTRLNTRIEVSLTQPVNGVHVLHNISLDIVPAVHISDWWPDGVQRKDLCQAGDCRIVFTQPQSKYPWIGWTEPHGFVSFAAAEGRLLRGCPSIVRAAYMVVKRMSAYFCQYKLFPSYVIKAALLWCLDADGFSSWSSSDDVSSDVDADELLRLVQNVIRRLMCFAAQDYVPSFFLPKCRQPVWLEEKYLKQFHIRLYQYGLTYKDLFALDEKQSQDYWVQLIKSLFVCSHVMYWAVLPDSDSHELFHPSVIDPLSENIYDM